MTIVISAHEAEPHHDSEPTAAAAPSKPKGKGKAKAKCAANAAAASSEAVAVTSDNAEGLDLDKLLTEARKAVGNAKDDVPSSEA